MRHWLTAVLLTVSVAIPGYAQRGGHAGGFSGSHSGSVSHIGGGFGGGFRSGAVMGGGFHSGPSRFSSPRTFNPAPRYGWSTPTGRIGMPRTPIGSWNRGWQRSPGYGGHYGYRQGNRYSRYRQPYLPYFYARSTYFVPNLLNSYWDYSDGFDVNDDGYAAAQPQSSDYGSYGQDPPQDYPQQDYPQQQQAPSYQAQDVPPPPPGPVEPTPLAATTLIFKDGHSQQVRNYAMTQRVIYVLDDAGSGRRAEIPLAQIDLVATQKTNQANGIEFSIPGIAN